MYIWVGIDVDSQLREIEALSLKAREEIGCAPPDFTLPLHVSLKISFEVPDREVERVVRDIENIYRESGVFIMKVRGIEYCEVITWIAIERNRSLDALHDRLNTFLKDKYGVPLHEYDTDYKYHSTLYMDDDRERVRKVYEKIKDEPIPRELIAERFLVGMSKSGVPGTYEVVSHTVK